MNPACLLCPTCNTGTQTRLLLCSQHPGAAVHDQVQHGRRPEGPPELPRAVRSPGRVAPVSVPPAGPALSAFGVCLGDRFPLWAKEAFFFMKQTKKAREPQKGRKHQLTASLQLLGQGMGWWDLPPGLRQALPHSPCHNLGTWICLCTWGLLCCKRQHLGGWLGGTAVLGEGDALEDGQGGWLCWERATPWRIGGGDGCAGRG